MSGIEIARFKVTDQSCNTRALVENLDRPLAAYTNLGIRSTGKNVLHAQTSSCRLALVPTAGDHFDLHVCSTRLYLRTSAYDALPASHCTARSQHSPASIRASRRSTSASRRAFSLYIVDTSIPSTLCLTQPALSSASARTRAQFELVTPSVSGSVQWFVVHESSSFCVSALGRRDSYRFDLCEASQTSTRWPPA